MPTKITPGKKTDSNPPSVHPTKPPPDKAALDEMGAEDENPNEARESEDKNGPAKKPKT